MEQNAKRKNKKSLSKSTVISLIMIFLITCAFSFFDLFQKVEYRLFDAMLKIQQPVEESSDICIIDIDDESISYLGSWPWKRDILTEVLYRLKELGAETAAFDIEYLDKSDFGIEEGLAETVESEFQNLITILDEKAGHEELGEKIAAVQEKISHGFINYDDEFAKAIEFFGNTFLTVNVRDIGVERTPEELDYVTSRFLTDKVTGEKDLIEKNNETVWKEESDIHKRGYVPALDSLLRHAKGIGFTNVVVDRDGVRRRVELLNSIDGKYALQLAFSPLVKNLDVKEIERTKNHIILHEALIPGTSERKDIKIPVDKNGCMYINWSHNNYLNSFNHIPLYYIYDLYRAEKRIPEELEALYSSEDLDVDSAGNETLALLDLWTEVEEDYNSLTSLKNRNIIKCGGFDADGNPKKRGSRGGGLTDEDYKAYFAARKAFMEKAYTLAKGILKNSELCTVSEAKLFAEHMISYYTGFEALEKVIKGKFCLIGNSASASTDLGVTPFEKRFANLGTHANVVNTILQEKFITEGNQWTVLTGAFFLVLIVLVVTKNLSPAKKNIFGSVYVVAIPLVLVSLMVFGRIYLPVFLPSSFGIAVYLSQLILNFLAVEGDKNFIKGAFSQCLSVDVVNDIIKNPSSLRLGGYTYDMSAIFTDIQKFSGFSEFLTPEELVAFLNYYLTSMSDIIINEKGTVDKYEGDAIVAFTGAPVQMEEHAVRACTAAIKMKLSEAVMNKEIEDYASGKKTDEIEPDLLSAFNKMVSNKRNIFTRIGINSGDMVAGFMGSSNKKNYTIMGNNVNLASRLEGVNKQYSTDGILISEHTVDSLKKVRGDSLFLMRKLDRVRVVNVNTPLRLYELIGFREDADEDQLKYLSHWNMAISTFESKDYDKALKMFEFLNKKRPQDKVAKYYTELIKKFFIKGKYPVKEDDFGVEYNPMDGVFTLLQK